MTDRPAAVPHGPQMPPLHLAPKPGPGPMSGTRQPPATRRQAMHRLGQALLLPVLNMHPLMAVMPLALTGCASAPTAPRLLRWPTLPVDSATPTADTSTDTSTDTTTAAAPGAWQLMPWGALPEWLDRTDVLVADGPAGLRALPGVRWAEPLRDALPRLLALDLAALRAPQPLWTGTPPAGTRISRQLRVQLLALDNLPQAGQVRLLARWSLADPASSTPPLLVDEQVNQPWDGSADGLALAQRAALRTLARRITSAQPPAVAARP